MPDAPGRLIKLLQVVADSGANILEIGHDRLSSVLGPNEILVHVACEVGGQEHGRALIAALKAAGYGHYHRAAVMDIYEAAGDRRQYMDLLLLADESPRMIERYIGRGAMFVLSDMGRAIGEILVTDEGGGVLEIKSLAVIPAYQRHGCGRMLIEYVEREYAGRFGIGGGYWRQPAERPVLRALRAHSVRTS